MPSPANNGGKSAAAPMNEPVQRIFYTFVTMNVSLAFIRALPKVELHCHLEGALRLSTLWEFMQRYEPRLFATVEAFRTASTVEREGVPGFAPFLEKFGALRFHYGSIENIERVAAECVETAANDGVIYLELRYSPIFFARRMLKGDAANGPVSIELTEAAAEAVMRGARREAAKRGMRVSFLVTCSRHFGFEVNKPALDLLHHRESAEILGLDLAGDESVDASAFNPSFLEWKAAGKFITIHAGEDPRGAGAAHVLEALDLYGADRIGHGVRVIEDARAVERVAREGVPLELCPTSNVQTQAAADAARHPLKRLLDAGVCATINTDDPTICGTSLSEEYLLASERMGLSFEDLKRCAVNTARAAFLPRDEKRALTERIEAAWGRV
ncbi:MAG TPA: adenosine deaminase [Planctomycetota bacterium]|nr:adenosine deaminase [Planctomycetota bacterium]